MLTDYNYEYEDKKYEAVVKNLKATFFDIILREEAVLNNLESRIADETDESVRRQLSELWGKQNDNLVDTLAHVQALAASMRKLDSFVKELNMIDEKLVSEIMSEVDSISTNKVNNDLEDNKEIVDNDIQSQPVIDEGDIDIDFDPNFSIDPNNDEKAFEPIDNEKDEITENSEEPTLNDVTIDSNEENVVDLPQVEKEDEEDVELPQVQADSIVPTEDEVVDNVVSPETTIDNKSMEPLVPTFSDSNVDKNIEEQPSIDATDNSVSVENENSQAVVENKRKVTIDKLLRESNDKVKAIIVSNSQYNKLASSFDTQEALVYARGVFSDEIIEASNANLSVYHEEEKAEVPASASASTSTTIQLPGENQPQLVMNHNSDEMELVLPTQTSINVVSNQTQNTHTIEQMLEQANELYKSGRTQDAQVMYEEISRMNQAIQNNNVKAA